MQEWGISHKSLFGMQYAGIGDFTQITFWHQMCRNGLGVKGVWGLGGWGVKRVWGCGATEGWSGVGLCGVRISPFRAITLLFA